MKKQKIVCSGSFEDVVYKQVKDYPIQDNSDETNNADVDKEETEKLIKSSDTSNLRDMVLSLKSEFEKLKQDTDIESNWKQEVTTKLEELQLRNEFKVDQEKPHTKRWRHVIEEENKDEESLEFSVEKDTFSLMMFSPFFSLIYWTGIVVSAFQIGLVYMLYKSLWQSQENWELVDGEWKQKGTFNIPFGVDEFVRVGQYFVAFLSIAFQTDIHDAIHYFLLLRKGNTNNWKILAENQAPPQEDWELSIFRSVYFPNLLRLCQGCATLWIVVIIIKKNDDFLDLLMNFTAIYVVSEIDNIIFKLIRKGFCPCSHIVKTAAIIEDIKFQEYKKVEGCQSRLCNSLNVQSFALLVSTVFILFEVTQLQWKQDSGKILRQRYPNCYVDSPSWIGDGWCAIGAYNTEECGWDGGDCLVDGYPDCHVGWPEWIGDGKCDAGEYNTEECGWDGGDCLVDNQKLWEKYPFCKKGIDPSWIRDGHCDGGAHNTEECSWDGNDCLQFNEKYPKCHVKYPSSVGDGWCDGGEYNSVECGWDGGDCLEFNDKVKEKYPNCEVIDPYRIGDYFCDGGEYNTIECGWDGGDCALRKPKLKLGFLALFLGVIVLPCFVVYFKRRKNKHTLKVRASHEKEEET